MIRNITVLFSIILLVGCSTYFPVPTKYEPPTNISDIAKIRLMGNPLYYSIRQKNNTGVMAGGFVVEHNRFLNLGFGTTVDNGFPKIEGKDYTGKYFETFVIADRMTDINYLAPNCSVTLEKIIPKKDALYEVHYSDTDLTGFCVLYIRPVVFDEVNSIYIEGRF